jgi:hypothetical protein
MGLQGFIVLLRTKPELFNTGNHITMNRFFIPLFLLLLSCCNNNKTVSLVQDGEISYHREANTNDYFYCQCDNDYFIGNPARSKTIYVHNVKNGNMLKKIELPVTKPIQGFYFFSNSSVFFSPAYSTQILEYNPVSHALDTIVDLTVELLTRLKMDGTHIGSSIEFICGPSAPLIASPPHYFISNIVMPLFEKEEQIPLFHFVFNNDTLLIDNSIGRFPEHYFEEGKTMAPFNSCLSYATDDRDQIIVSHLADHNLYVYDLNGNCKTALCKSKYIKHLPEKISLLDLESEDRLQERENSSAYIKIIYDPYHNCYYRFVSVSEENNGKNKGHDFSVMILDADLNVKGEQRFKNVPYSAFGALAAPQGLLLKKDDDFSGKTTYGVFKLNGI